MIRRTVTLILSCLILLTSCKKDPPLVEEKPPPVLEAELGEELSGGQVSVRDASPNAFGFQAAGLADYDQLLFFVGNSFFNQNWVSSPASTTARDGLGPFFNARSCASCHFKDGRGRPPLSPTEKGRGLLLRLSVPGVSLYGGPKPDPIYGHQLQDQAVLNLEREGDFDIIYTELPGKYPDGEPYSLRAPHYQLTKLFYGAIDPQVQISPRVAPQMIGLGLLEALDESTILGFADEADQNGDGISGKPNYVWDFVNNRVSLGRFGWKANEASVLQQVSGAFLGDLGITTFVFPDENCVEGIDCDSLPNGGDVEIDDDDLEKVALYSSVLAVPMRRDWENKEVLRGKAKFNEIGCASCHIPKMKTGIHPKFDALSDQTIRPYTDLLLHDMGDELADHRPDYEADGNEWRTPPLWGVGLFQTVNDHTFYLHDGRARNLEEAILWHGGEATDAKESFKQLSKVERSQIIQFLNSL